jgi:multiple sugar transport system substrate-binding protein
MGVVGLVLVLGLGCTGKPTASPKAYEGVVVKVACPEGPLAALIANYGKVWGPQNGARVEIVTTAARPESVELPPADLCLLPPAELPRWAAAGQLLPVPAAYLAPGHRYGWGELLRVYRNKLVVWEGQVNALPLLGHALLCYYRNDWFREAGHQTAFLQQYGRPLAAPATWDDFADLAAFFHHRAGVETPSPSLPPLPDTDDGLDEVYYAIAAPLARRAVAEDNRQPPPDEEMLSFHYDFKTGRARIDQPAFVEAFRLLKRLQAHRPARAAGQPAEAFRQGRAALSIAGTEWVARFQDEQSAVRGRFGVCRVPGSRRVFAYQTGQAQPTEEVNYVPYLGTGGGLAVVPRSAAHPEAAFALLAELSGPQVSAEIVLGSSLGGGPCRREHLDLLKAGNVFGLESGVARALVESLRLTLDPPIKNPVLRLRTPDEGDHLRAFAAEVRPALLRSDADPNQVMKAVAQRWRQLDGLKDERQRKADYCRSLSIPPEK